MKVSRVYVSGYAKDLHLVRICIASIRYWYPDITIYLLKDTSQGDFDTEELERFWDVKVFNKQEENRHGWAMSKLEAFYTEDKGSFLYLDSDIAITGPILDVVKDSDAEFIVHPTYRGTDEVLLRSYYDIDAVKKMDPEFEYPGYTFVAGNFFGTSGIIDRKDLEQLFDKKDGCLIPRPYFRCADQGTLNYYLAKLHAERRISLELKEFMLSGRDEENLDKMIPVKDILEKKSPPLLIHWYGTDRSILCRLHGHKILHFYENYYYSRIPYGWIKKWHRFYKGRLIYLAKMIKLKLFLLRKKG